MSVTCGKTRCYDYAGRTPVDSQFTTTQASVQAIATCTPCTQPSFYSVQGRATQSATGTLFYALDSSSADTGAGFIPYTVGGNNATQVFWIAAFDGTIESLIARIDQSPVSDIPLNLYLARPDVFDSTAQTPQVMFTPTSALSLNDSTNSFSFKKGDLISAAIATPGRTSVTITWGVRVTPT